jgi:hypothetical protein
MGAFVRWRKADGRIQIIPAAGPGAAGLSASAVPP